MTCARIAESAGSRDINLTQILQRPAAHVRRSGTAIGRNPTYL